MKNLPNNILLHLCALIIIGLFAFSCSNHNSGQERSNNSNAAPKKNLTEFERKLKELRTADFNYIFVVKRTDKEAFDNEDKTFLREKTYRANRRRLTDDGKILFIGTNYKLIDKDLESLKKRYEVEDFSKSEEQIEKEKKEKRKLKHKSAKFKRQ